MYVGVLGATNGLELLRFYVIYRPYGTFYYPPLNIMGETWFILGGLDILLGLVFAIVGTTGIARSRLTWLFGVAVYSILVILSIAQTQNYFISSSFEGESGFGLLGTIIGVATLFYLLAPRSRVFFFARTNIAGP